MDDRRIALVTGANKGIGREIAGQLGVQGITVLVGGPDPSRGPAAAAALRSAGIDAHWLRLDVTDLSTIAAAAARIEAQWGRLDILVNNAGIIIDNGAPSELDPSLLRRTYETNVFGMFDMIRTLLP